MVSLIVSTFAIALFARQYGVTCQKCHTVIPHLTAFGAHFLASGDRMPGVSSGPELPLAAKVNLVGSSERQGAGADGAGLPKAIVDEVELFTSGTIGARGSFFVEQYVLDGGEPGALREAWISDRIDPWDARIPVYLQAGKFTLPLPVDPETFRETAQHYAIYDQTVGDNPFNFFDAQSGAKLTAGDTLHGLSVQLAKTAGAMAFVSDVAGPVTFGIYRYAASHFTRTGYSVVIDRRKWTSETVVQTGWNANAGGAGGVASSGGFTQLRYTFDRRFFAIARYDGTDEAAGIGFTRDAVIGAGFAPMRNARITLEDVITHAPGTRHTMNLQFTAGY